MDFEIRTDTGMLAKMTAKELVLLYLRSAVFVLLCILVSKIHIFLFVLFFVLVLMNFLIRAERIREIYLKLKYNSLALKDKGILIKNFTVKRFIHQDEIEEICLIENEKHSLDFPRFHIEIFLKDFREGYGDKVCLIAKEEEMDTIEDVIEPFLLQMGFINRTPRGRVATEHAYRHLNMEIPSNLQDKLL